MSSCSHHDYVAELMSDEVVCEAGCVMTGYDVVLYNPSLLCRREELRDYTAGIKGILINGVKMCTVFKFVWLMLRYVYDSIKSF